MTLYIARLADTKELVAIFEAASMNAIFWSLDRVVNPAECEYAQVGGLFIGFPRSGVGVFDPEDEDGAGPYSGAEVDPDTIGQWLPGKALLLS